MEIRSMLRKPHVQAITLIATLALAIVSNTIFGGTALGFVPIIFGLLVVAEIALFVSMEVKEGAEKHGWKHEAMDTAIALGVALLIWFGASFVLNTSSPVSAVVSCSMLPNLYRGDFVLVQGAPVKAYELEMTRAELESLTDEKAFVSFGGKNVSIDGSLFPYCLQNRYSEACQAFVNSPGSVSEKKGAFTYSYQSCPVTFKNGSTASAPCLKSVSFRGKEYLTNFSHDIIVYAPPEGDLYASIGDIVHRTFFAIDVDGEKYYVTRGDNNPLLDMQVYDYGTGLTNHPVPQDSLRGKVVARIPLLGYFKLFLSGFFQEDSQCRMQLQFEHN
ncbi:MAG: hypothetical protein AB1324_00320 [Candidatus Micrarchaeota archaeon]